MVNISCESYFLQPTAMLNIINAKNLKLPPNKFCTLKVEGLLETIKGQPFLNYSCILNDAYLFCLNHAVVRSVERGQQIFGSALLHEAEIKLHAILLILLIIF